MENESLKIQHQRLPDLVMEQLMDWIMDGKIHMGQKLNTEELAQQLGVSRMPVREALKNLEKLGIAESVPYAGARVVKLTKSDVRQIYIMRKALEPVAGFYACQNITDQQIAEVEEIQNRFEQVMSVEKPSAKQIYIHNREFHFAIYNISGLDRLCEMIKMLWDNLAFYKLIYGLTYVDDKVEASRMISEHRGYIDALRVKKPEELQKRLTVSLERHEVDVPYKVSSYIDDCIDE
ncbi:GntR family transcriptional regulator [Hydrogenoanaerobacterium sp.]|uniref:GntR family transcriptional regulator n=1 Tax=Hydrogenoanaerobacterium sp. TaxID=2953763 RepID=UPI00289A51EB|nr:GntR family transcriptional regulator [Hydrogenoanaerobacterium sp.]